MGSHGCNRVELVDGGYVLQCKCGWVSPAADSAEVVGSAWDQHLAEDAA